MALYVLDITVPAEVSRNKWRIEIPDLKKNNDELRQKNWENFYAIINRFFGGMDLSE